MLSWAVSSEGGRLRALIPTYPNCAGGLGFLEMAPIAFSPIVLAWSAIERRGQREFEKANFATPPLAIIPRPCFTGAFSTDGDNYVKMIEQTCINPRPT
jgi:hypothetical protein